MDIVKLIQSLDISVEEMSLLVIVVLTLVQVTPIKINPWSWIAKKIGRAINGEVIQKVDNLEAQVKTIEEKAEEREAVNFRVRILRFNDELQRGQKHSKDSFDQVMSDITNYNNYCKIHEDFLNNQTEATVAYIEKQYATRLEKRDFLS